MGDPFLAYKEPSPQLQAPVSNSLSQLPDSIKKSIQTSSVSRDISKVEKEASSLGFAGGGAIAAIVVGIVAIALAGTALHEANDHGEDDHRFSTLIVGANNRISNSSFSMIGGGTNNSITQDSDNSFIGGGESNKIQSGSDYAVILGGEDNNIGSDITAVGKPRWSAIVGGSDHWALANRSAIVGGQTGIINETNGDDSIILGGNRNIISAPSCGILAGDSHSIRPGSQCVGILGGIGLSTFSGTSFFQTGMTGKYNSNGVSEIVANHVTGTPTEFNFMVGGGTALDQRTNAFTVDNLGNIYYGTSYGASIYFRNADHSFSAKHFTIQHPTEEERWLVHGCLEGPEAGVYYRGKDIAPTSIKLPEYATKIADDFTVQITPIGQPRLVGSTEVNEDGFFDVMGEGKFHWHVTGRRLEIDPEPNKESIIVNRWGPYTWNEKV